VDATVQVTNSTGNADKMQAIQFFHNRCESATAAVSQGISKCLKALKHQQHLLSLEEAITAHHFTA
jgi:hypothetical protein